MTTKLLIADDSLTIQKVVSLTFSDQDVVIETAVNGDEVFEKARHMRPDIILADVFMPGRNGYEVCEAIKADPLLRETPVVLLVGSFEPFDASEASRVGCDAHITKPFDTAELTELVHRLVAKPTNTIPEDTPVSPQTTFPHQVSMGNLVSSRARESFLGSDRILDLLDPRAFEPPAPPPVAVVETPPAPSPVAVVETTSEMEKPEVSSVPESAGAIPPDKVDLSERTLDLIVDRVVKRMSREVVREIAWEVIPELAENILRQYLEESDLPGNR